MTTDIKRTVESFYKDFPARSWPKGQIIIQAGDEPAGIYFIESGGVRQYTINQNGDEVVVNFFKNPAFMPMSWAINNTRNEYFFETTDETILRLAPRDKTLQFLRDNPDVAFDLLGRVFSGLDGILMRMAHLMSSSAYVRILHELVIQARRQNASQKSGSIQLPIKEFELGTFCGLTRETVSREFKKLKTANLVKVDRRGIIIKDIAKLVTELEKRL